MKFSVGLLQESLEGRQRNVPGNALFTSALGKMMYTFTYVTAALPSYHCLWRDNSNKNYKAV